MKSKKILTLIFAVLLVFSLFGCGKKEPVEDAEPQDTVEQEKLPPHCDGKRYTKARAGGIDSGRTPCTL